MTKRTKLFATVTVVLASLTACGTDNRKDLEGVNFKDPDMVQGYNNVDGNPNITMVCISGVAFYTITRDYNSIGRVPEWDKLCPGGTAK